MIFSVVQKNRVWGYSWSILLWHRCNYPHQSRDAFFSRIFSNVHCFNSFKSFFMYIIGDFWYLSVNTVKVYLLLLLVFILCDLGLVLNNLLSFSWYLAFLANLKVMFFLLVSKSSICKMIIAFLYFLFGNDILRQSF